MEKLETLKNIADGQECSHCGEKSTKFIAPSISIDKVTYSTCSSCGNVQIIRELVDDNNETVFRFEDTPKNISQEESLSLKLMINDAKASYDAINNPVKYCCTTEEEANEYKEQLSNDYDEYEDDDYDDFEDNECYFNDYEEDNDYENSLLYDSEDIFKNDNKPIETSTIDSDDELSTYIIINNKTHISSGVVAKNLDELSEIIERDFADIDVRIYKVSDVIAVSKKTILTVI